MSREEGFAGLPEHLQPSNLPCEDTTARLQTDAQLVAQDIRNQKERLYAACISSDGWAPMIDALLARLEACQAELVATQEKLKEHRKDVAYHADCRPNRRQAEAYERLARETNDKWADEVKAHRETSEQLVACVRERDDLQAALDRMHGARFSDRVYHALKSRAEQAEAEIEELTDKLRWAVEVLKASRDVHATLATQVAVIPGQDAYSTRMSEAERRAWSQVKDIESLVGQVEALLASSPPSPSGKEKS